MKRFDFGQGSPIDIKKMLEARNPASYGQYEEQVSSIVEDVRKNGDEAVFRYTAMFDKAAISLQTLRVTESEMEEAFGKVDKAYVRSLEKAAARIEAHHQKQRRYSWFDTDAHGTMLGQKVLPIERAGVYVPGGKAVYPSSVLMNVLPAKVAGVEHILMTTPPDAAGKVNPLTLVAARISGVEEIYKVGGAQAIAAMAFGTGTIPKVDKIVGPGNIYVALAKKAVYGFVNIDSIAGPSEILVIADETANPAFVAADMLSQAEHDELASAVLVTTSRELADQVERELKGQTSRLSRSAIIEASLENYGAIVVVGTLEEAIAITNEIAPEHLEICTRDPFEVMNKVRNAGAIFLGNFSPEPLGDYMAGPNHVLPTNATSRFFSPLSVDDFIKKTSIIHFNEAALKELEEDIIRLAEGEELTAHAQAVRIRFAGDGVTGGTKA
ncbi:histidinol dehydrogenase [Anaerotalea alkaliphila]|uniref:Histidinol dehydrogenase n=1 Tax=Anaerotalea alkaliphila TaxID=2662126 RepID=A0A7X5HY07_9FIRM|nr:histidinol dehydrogenase [Anaerotalea alkaliphila]NDL68676.1 histidinol dehydrogenase [Anaerotalea alkaliphila]